eukprot:CAMPEP_0114583080 /NCGR_PEP_ID=MMETSP0125-20121206/6899_1 /TAXON_ID=485358 ORGANISM="Aristerostoma sp., Strain ATCC 50986" /NCGR_SAMPLE_ID=MMETSP0125 /ASSEMBLY_ACC=CAM_ASM_000245 /LENGTH=203 /DNA_ID=CAMNT_0001776351 /DNA_START=304 /DNA_END=915 /DNA_ORIENTATION=+
MWARNGDDDDSVDRPSSKASGVLGQKRHSILTKGDSSNQSTIYNGTNENNGSNLIPSSIKKFSKRTSSGMQSLKKNFLDNKTNHKGDVFNSTFHKSPSNQFATTTPDEKRHRMGTSHSKQRKKYSTEQDNQEFSTQTEIYIATDDNAGGGCGIFSHKRGNYHLNNSALGAQDLLKEKDKSILKDHSFDSKLNGKRMKGAKMIY